MTDRLPSAYQTGVRGLEAPQNRENPQHPAAQRVRLPGQIRTVVPSFHRGRKAARGATRGARISGEGGRVRSYWFWKVLMGLSLATTCALFQIAAGERWWLLLAGWASVLAHGVIVQETALAGRSGSGS